MSDTDAWDDFYRLLKHLGFPKPENNFELNRGRVSVAWPDMKLAIALDPDDPAPFKRAGWTVVQLTTRNLLAAAPVMALLVKFSFARILAESEARAEQNVSRTEGKLLEQLLRRGLPMPDRNLTFRRADNSMITVPDFAWEDVRLAVFVDGFRFHGDTDIDAVLALAVEDKEHQAQLRQNIADKQSRDAANRRDLAALGWTCMAVTDKEIDADGGVVAAEQIAAAYRSARASLAAAVSG